MAKRKLQPEESMLLAAVNTLDDCISATPDSRPVSPGAAKKKRISLTLDTRVEIINKKLESGLDDGAIAREYNTSRSTITKILSAKERILAAHAKHACASNDARNRVRIQGGQFQAVDDAVLDWMQAQKDADITLNDQCIQEAAARIYNEMKAAGYPFKKGTFEASNGWLRGFKYRNDLSVRTEGSRKSSIKIPTSVTGVDISASSMLLLGAIDEPAQPIINTSDIGSIDAVNGAASVAGSIEGSLLSGEYLAA